MTNATNSPRVRLHALQYLRAVAALAVVYSHSTMQYDAYKTVLPYTGAFGVDIFFVISGFIMVWIARDTDRPASFFVNRVRRVVPMYWFFTLLMVAIMFAMPSAFRNASFDLPSLLLSLGFIPHWSLAHPGEFWPLVPPGWSLIYEMYFYLVFALALFARPAWRVAIITLVISAVFLLASASGDGSATTALFSESIVFEFILGMLLAISFKRGLRLPSSTGACLIVLGICIFMLDPQVPHIFRFGIPAWLIVIGCVNLNLPENRLGLLLGDSSYALYLSHIFVLGVLRKILPPLLGDSAVAAWLFVLISCVVCIVAGIVTHLLVDNWLLRSERLSFLRRNKPAGDIEVSDAARQASSTAR